MELESRRSDFRGTLLLSFPLRFDKNSRNVSNSLTHMGKPEAKYDAFLPNRNAAVQSLNIIEISLVSLSLLEA